MNVPKFQCFMAAIILCLSGGPLVHGQDVAASGGQTAADQFNRAYRILSDADRARDDGDRNGALKQYRAAMTAYMGLADRYPDWEPGIVRFRIAYCDNQIEAIMRVLDRHSATGLGQPPEAEEPPATIQPSDDVSQIKADAAGLLRDAETAEAQRLLLEGIKLAPGDATIRLLMGIAQCQAARYADAVVLLEQLVADAPANARAHVVLGTAYFGMAATKDAIAELRRAIELDPNMGEAHYNLTQALLALDPPDMDGARRHYQRATDLGGPRDPDVERRLGR